MVLAIAIAVVALLLVSFLFLTVFETKHGRYFGPLRERLDTVAERAGLTLSSGRILVSAGHALSASLRFIVHEAVHGILSGIRMLERLLTRAARTIRESNAAHALLSRKEKAPKGETETVE